MTKKLSHKKRKSIAALMTCNTVAEASVAAGVGHRTITRWLAEDVEFQAGLAEAEREAIAEAARRIAASSAASVNALLAVLENPAADTKEKISAASAILSHLPKVRLLGGLEKYIKDIEASVQL